MKKLDEWKILWTDAVSKKEPLTEKAKENDRPDNGIKDETIDLADLRVYEKE